MRNSICIILAVCYSLLTAQNHETGYKKTLDSLHQINIRIVEQYKWMLKINPNVVALTPAILFLDIDGNAYDYRPFQENDSILLERFLYQKKIDSLDNLPFIELMKWHKTKLNKKSGDNSIK